MSHEKQPEPVMLVCVVQKLVERETAEEYHLNWEEFSKARGHDEAIGIMLFAMQNDPEAHFRIVIAVQDSPFMN